jgi:hypothetical protein
MRMTLYIFPPNPLLVMSFICLTLPVYHVDGSRRLPSWMVLLPHHRPKRCAYLLYVPMLLQSYV